MPRRARASRDDVARALRRLHDGPAFPQGPTLPELAEMVRAYVPEDVVRTIVDVGRRLASSGRRAPCHRDVNPGNVMSTEHGVVLVDWDTASQDDPYFDVAQVGAFTSSADTREALFSAYLGRAPTDSERSEMAVARVLALAFYTAASAVAAMMAGEELSFSDDAPVLETLFEKGKPPRPAAMAQGFYRVLRRERAALN